MSIASREGGGGRLELGMVELCFGRALKSLISCEIGQTKYISRRIWSREEEWGREKGSGYLVCAGISKMRRRRLQVLNEKFVGLEGTSWREKK
jgi:hypothetical protein